MKLKYYLRGLGIGIICTSFILTIAFSAQGKAPAMTDAQIITKAKELGLVEPPKKTEDVSGQGTQDAQADQNANENADNPGAGTDNGSGDGSGDGSTPTDDTNTPPAQSEGDGVGDAAQGGEPVADASSEEGLEQGTATQWVPITIAKGEYSDKVSRKLYDAQLIDDPVAFNKYLIQQGMDTRLIGGVHSIPRGSSKEEIAKMLTQKP
ncbi:hypothetical protein FACS1894111_02720 [Clostridia bacterium]|nr:hypothetical protein FACS1894111_02720 [Clostridia bacterium]